MAIAAFHLRYLTGTAKQTTVPGVRLLAVFPISQAILWRFEVSLHHYRVCSCPIPGLEAFRAIRHGGGRMVGIQLTLATALESTTL
jgi:hypothetical protein